MYNDVKRFYITILDIQKVGTMFLRAITSKQSASVISRHDFAKRQGIPDIQQLAANEILAALRMSLNFSL